MAKSLKLLLLENVEALGIVGDVVNVRLGYARNFLLPRNLATTPSDELIKSLAGKRAEAEKQLALQRKHREELTAKLQGVELDLIKSVNDQGHLYASVTQQEISNALTEKGMGVKPRDIRLHEVVKRIGNYDVHIKLDSDLDATIKLHVKPDRELDILKEHKEEHPAPAQGEQAGPSDADAKPGKKPKADKHAKHDDKPKAEEKPAKGEFGAKGKKDAASGAEPDAKPAKGEFGAKARKEAASGGDAEHKPAKEKPAKGEKKK